MLRRTFAVVLTIVAVLAAGWLALRRADIPYDTLETAYSLPQTQFMTLDDGLKVHFTDTGPSDRSTLVLIHGFSSSLHTWNDWRDSLDADYRVITIDLPGHGLTRAYEDGKAGIELFADVVHEVTQKRGADRFTIAGNSMGGNTAWSYAVKYPETVEGLILVDASGWAADDEDEDNGPLIFKLLRNPLARTLLKDLDMTSMTKSGLEDSYTDQSFVTDELVERYVSLSRAPGHRATLLGIMAGERTPATAEAMATIKVPTLIMWGRDDNLIPVSSAQKFADTIENSKLVIYDNVGHLPQEEVATQSIADVRAFMNEVEWSALDEEVIVPAGDPTLQPNRPGGN
jgi:pimeloyl-ACP methyl ester carboxylesterase